MSNLAPAREAAPIARGAGVVSRSRSAIYEGWVSHRRSGPVSHSFRYRMFMPLLDLGELTSLIERMPLWSARRWAPARWRRSDYLRGHHDDLPLAEAARELVRERTGFRAEGRVSLLANPRYWGVGFNPVSFLYLHDRSGRDVEAVIAEVTSTPWGERRCYVLPRSDSGSGGLHGGFDKRMHVSPFLPMEQRYEWSATPPGERLGVTIRNREGDRVVFEAALALERREMTPATMREILFRYPPMTISTLARIYWNAARLKSKGAPWFQRPDSEATGAE
jgi:uncharacterized protein